MRKRKYRFPVYDTMIGKETEISGDIRFTGGLHIDGKVIGNVIGLSDVGCALSLGQSGFIAGSLDVAYVRIDGTITGDVRAIQAAELAPGARIQGALYYGMLEMSKGAEVNGKLLHVEGKEMPRLEYHGVVSEESESRNDAARSEVRPADERGTSPDDRSGHTAGAADKVEDT
jgi:cytoskeletal protein CcmA (bactofilin family)